MKWATRLLIGVTLVFAPWAFGCTEPWSLKVLEWLCLGSAISFLLEQRRQPKLQIRYPWVFVLGCLLLFLVGAQLVNPLELRTIAHWSVYDLVRGDRSWPHTINWLATLKEGTRWACFLLFGFVAAHHIKTRQDFFFILAILVINTVLVSLEGILQALSDCRQLLWFRIPRHGGDIFGPFVCRNNFVSYANLALPFALGLALFPGMRSGRDHDSQTPQRFFWAFCAAVLFAAVVVSGSRAGVLVSLTIVCVMIFDLVWRRARSSSQKQPWSIWFLLLLGGGFVALSGGTLELKRRFYETDWLEPTRVEIWKASWNAATESLWWGHGLGTFRYLFPFYKPMDILLFYEYAHNDWLEAIFDLGVVGFGLLILLVVSILVLVAKERIFKTSSFRRSVATATFVSLMGCLGHALVDFPLHIAAVQITFITVTALGLASSFLNSASGHHSSGSGP